MPGSYNGFFSIGMFEEELESEQWLRLIPPFLSDRLGETFARMIPEPSLDANLGVHALADPQHTKILFLAVGDFDSYDTGGVDLALRLGGVSGEFSAVWFDPRTGNETPAGTFQGGNDYVVPPPSLDDWVLLLTSTAACDAPDPLMAASRDGTDVLLTWAASSDPGVSWNVYRGTVPDPTVWGAAPDTNVPDDDPGTHAMHQYRDAGAAGSGQPSYYYLRTTVTSCGESGNPSLLP